MAKIRDILNDISHRPGFAPEGKWAFYQEWNHVLFFHWKVDAHALRKLIPAQLDLDLFDGQAWISLVPFTMQRIRPRFFPAFAPVSDFHEINVRTYVIRDGKPGVFFINIESQKWLSAHLSRHLSGLPYEKSMIRRSDGIYRASNRLRSFSLDAEFAIGEPVGSKARIDAWLTERYALFLEENGTLYRYDIHHKEWKIKLLALRKLRTDYKLPGLDLNRQPDLAQYSDGVEVVAWKRKSL